MTIKIIAVGKIKEKFYREALSEYGKRLSSYCKWEIIEVADEKTKEEASETEVLHGESEFCFVIGGSLGLAPSVLSRANYSLSFSAMTFPHQLMRVILLEQIYRAFRINAGEPYHK